jgi:membrane protease YdiL (CAAX protease family)
MEQIEAPLAQISAPESSADPIRRRYIKIELAAILLAFVLPPLAVSAMDAAGLRRIYPSPFLFRSLSGIANNLSSAAVILFVIWRSGDPFSNFGIRPFHIGKDLILGVFLWFVMRESYYAVWNGLRSLLSPSDYSLLLSQQTAHPFGPKGITQDALLALLCASTGFAEELLMRAYLLTRLEEFFGSTTDAVILTTIIFACFHSYQGAAGVIGAAINGLLSALVFCIVRRLCPLAFAHALHNFLILSRYPVP